jgi:nitrate reductase (NAD(P)H)
MEAPIARLSLLDSNIPDQKTPLPPTPPESTKDEIRLIPISSHTGQVIDITEFPLPPSAPDVEVLELDKPTPDAHVPRDPRLIRLTGVHPFNVEAPLKDLYDEGFLTSPNLFYVRNHGAVPKVEDDEIFDWTFTVEG